MIRLLLVDDQIQTREVVATYLRDLFHVHACSLSQAKERAQEIQPEIVLIALEKQAPLRLLVPELRSSIGTHFPIIVVIEEASPLTLQFLYDVGVDDTILRPLDFTQLFWKLKMSHRLASLGTRPGEHRKIGNLDFLIENRILKNAQSPVPTTIHLTKTQAHLLDFLISHTDKVLTRDQIKEKIWQQKRISARSIDAAISKIKSLHPDLDKRIHAIYGTGYMYSETLTTATKQAN